MSYPHPVHQIREIIAQPKCLPPDTTLDIQKDGESRSYHTRPQLADGRFVDMRYLGGTGAVNDPASYHASFLLSNQRVRGVDFEVVGRRNFRRNKCIPKGWHQNVCDPNLSTTHDSQNIHQALEEFAPTDFVDFINLTAKLWKIDLGWEWEGGLFS